MGVPLGVDAQENEVPDRVVWDRTPIRVVLPVGTERLVHFPEHAVRVGVPDTLPLRTLSVDGTVYWQAQAPFAPVRVIVQGLEEGGGYYLLDLEAQESAPAVALAILRPGTERPAHVRAGAPDEPRHQNLDYVALTRFAAQQMYAPARLRPAHPQVRPVAVPEGPIALVRGGTIEAVPLIGWRHRGLYVTAVRLQNRAPEPAVLDPRDLRGEWLAATFQHARLLAHGDEADTTAVYLLSRRPFGESLAGVR
ncbi:MAG: TIGR03749 family integrating conjugative element protein [Thioalkalivibrio sp.]|nr:MAG: TIGR03749 family integrating conjugative element protein [Thioalkalivibrio sp.]